MGGAPQILFHGRSAQPSRTMYPFLRIVRTWIYEVDEYEEEEILHFAQQKDTSIIIIIIIRDLATPAFQFSIYNPDFLNYARIDDMHVRFIRGVIRVLL